MQSQSFESARRRAPGVPSIATLKQATSSSRAADCGCSGVKLALAVPSGIAPQSAGVVRQMIMATKNPVAFGGTDQRFRSESASSSVVKPGIVEDKPDEGYASLQESADRRRSKKPSVQVVPFSDTSGSST